jgi:hypothetical protein
VWMMPSSNAQAGAAAGGTESIWAFPQSASGGATMYRGMPSGLHFMNFPAPMALLPGGQQLGLGTNDNGGASGGSEGHVGVLAALNAYRAQVAAAAQNGAEGSSQQQQQRQPQESVSRSDS